MVETDLEIIFPALRSQPYQITSPINLRYNCVAFAAGDIQRWWWPDEAGEDAWPETVARAETVECFRDAFATLGYAVCANDVHEPGYERLRCLRSQTFQNTPPANSPAGAGPANSGQGKTSNTIFMI
jgi:hypothetical protein